MHSLSKDVRGALRTGLARAISATEGAVCPERPLSGTILPFLLQPALGAAANREIWPEHKDALGRYHFSVCVYLFAIQSACVCVYVGGCIF